MKTPVKIVLSIGMLVLAARTISVDQIRQALSELSIYSVSIVIVGYIIGQAMSAIKWWFIARSGKIDCSLPNTMRAYFIGMYINCFGLGTIGGDLSRSLLLSKYSSQTDKKTESIASVAADRIHGLIVLGVLALIGSIGWYGSVSANSLLYPIISIIIVSTLCWYLVAPYLQKRFLNMQGVWNKIGKAISVFPRDAKTVSIITSLSVLFHLLQIWLHFFIAREMGIQISFIFVLATIPFVNILSSLPISWQGLGVRENGYRYFLGSALSPAHAIAMGAVWLLAIITTSAIGGALSVLNRKE